MNEILESFEALGLEFIRVLCLSKETVKFRDISCLVFVKVSFDNLQFKD